MIDIDNDMEVFIFLEKAENESGVARAVLDPYMESLIGHLKYVREAGKMLGLGEAQMLAHDASKFMVLEEFAPYAEKFYGEPESEDDFAIAWLHHLHHNPHHRQHWQFRDESQNGDRGGRIVNGNVEMPLKYAREMVADWMGAGRQYQGSWDMTEWLLNNYEGMKLHPRTRDYIDGILIERGYGNVVSRANEQSPVKRFVRLIAKKRQ